jgi:hypothetical protein
VGKIDLARNDHRWPPSAGINQFRFVRSTAAAALSARCPELPRKISERLRDSRLPGGGGGVKRACSVCYHDATSVETARTP